MSIRCEDLNAFEKIIIIFPNYSLKLSNLKVKTVARRMLGKNNNSQLKLECF
jgi:hypothetical protein